jgi:hypothetical protein
MSQSFTAKGLLRSSSSETSQLLYLAIQSYEKLMKSVRLDLSDSTRAAVDLSLTYIRGQLPQDALGPNTPSTIRDSVPIVEPGSTTGSADESAKQRRYLGEASDLHYFHTIKSILQGGDQPGAVTETYIQSYDHGIQPAEVEGGVNRSNLPTKELANTYVEIYFSTIHIAYPFVNKPSFTEKYERFWKENTEVKESSSWLSLMCESIQFGRIQLDPN